MQVKIQSKSNTLASGVQLYVICFRQTSSWRPRSTDDESVKQQRCCNSGQNADIRIWFESRLLAVHFRNLVFIEGHGASLLKFLILIHSYVYFNALVFVLSVCLFVTAGTFIFAHFWYAPKSNAQPTAANENTGPQSCFCWRIGGHFCFKNQSDGKDYECVQVVLKELANQRTHSRLK